jgi:pyruvate formate lyase activating enzyme
MKLSRRDLLVASARLVPIAGGAGLALASPGVLRRLAGVPAGDTLLAWSAFQDLVRSAPKARYWTTYALAGSNCQSCHAPGEDLARKSHTHNPTTVKCLLCAQGCAIKAGQRGKCRARMNVSGELRSLVYGRPAATHIDPIEKKPFYHFLPGAAALSFGTSGCPLRCKFCQNWELSQSSPEDLETRFTPPSEFVAAALSRQAPVIAFTYNEPTTFTEYLTDIARDARKLKVRSVMVSCGFMNEAPLAEMCEVLDAIKIDLKGYSESFYRTVCGAELKPVLRSIKQIAKSGTHLEIVNLVVPTLNDSDTDLRQLAEWVAGELGADVPVHFTRFHPDYQLLNLSPTPVATLEKARAIAMDKGLNYAYVGNVPDHPGNHTYCPACHKVVIARNGFFVTSMNIKDGRCGYCRRQIAGVWT